MRALALLLLLGLTGCGGYHCYGLNEKWMPDCLIDRAIEKAEAQHRVNTRKVKHFRERTGVKVPRGTTLRCWEILGENVPDEYILSCVQRIESYQ